MPTFPTVKFERHGPRFERHGPREMFGGNRPQHGGFGGHGRGGFNRGRERSDGDGRYNGHLEGGSSENSERPQHRSQGRNFTNRQSGFRPRR